MILVCGTTYLLFKHKVFTHCVLLWWKTCWASVNLSKFSLLRFQTSQNPPHLTTPSATLHPSQPASVVWAIVTAGHLGCSLLPLPSSVSTAAEEMLSASSQIMSHLCSRWPVAPILLRVTAVVPNSHQVLLPFWFHPVLFFPKFLPLQPYLPPWWYSIVKRVPASGPLHLPFFCLHSSSLTSPRVLLKCHCLREALSKISHSPASFLAPVSACILFPLLALTTL